MQEAAAIIRRTKFVLVFMEILAGKKEDPQRRLRVLGDLKFVTTIRPFRS